MARWGARQGIGAFLPKGLFTEANNASKSSPVKDVVAPARGIETFNPPKGSTQFPAQFGQCTLAPACSEPSLWRPPPPTRAPKNLLGKSTAFNAMTVPAAQTSNLSVNVGFAARPAEKLTEPHRV